MTLTRLSGNVEAAGMHTSGLDKAISVSFSFDLDAEEEGDKSDENSASEEGKVNPGVGGGNYNPGFESSKDDLTVEFSKGGASSEGGQDNPTFDADGEYISETEMQPFEHFSSFLGPKGFIFMLAHKPVTVTVCHDGSQPICAHFCSEWNIVGYGTGASWEWWNWSVSSSFVLNQYISM